MIRYRLSATAENDLTDIYLYWTEPASAPVADRVLDKIVERFGLLAAYPDAGRLCSEIASGIRCFPAGKHLTYYRSAHKSIDIVYVFHGSRDQRRAFSESGFSKN